MLFGLRRLIGNGDMAGANRLRTAWRNAWRRWRLRRVSRTRSVHSSNTFREKRAVLSYFLAAWGTLKSVVLNVTGALLYLGIFALLFKAVMYPAIVIAPIYVSKDLAERGYTPEVVSLQI